MSRSLAARRSLAALATAPLLAAGLAGCGDDGGSTEAKDPAVGAALLSDLQEGDQVDPDDFVDTVTDGIEQSTTAHVTMTMATGPMTIDSKGEVDYTTDPPSTRMEMTIPGAGAATVLLVDGIMYLQSDGLTGEKYWKIDPSASDGPLAGSGLDQMLQQGDPASALDAMRSGIDEVTYEGQEAVDGRDLDRYELTIDLQKIIDGFGADLPSEAASAMPDSVTYDLWLDEENRFAQMEAEYPIMDQKISMTMVVDDWGTDVSIDAPAPDEITEAPDLGSMTSPSAGDA